MNIFYYLFLSFVLESISGAPTVTQLKKDIVKVVADNPKILKAVVEKIKNVDKESNQEKDIEAVVDKKLKERGVIPKQNALKVVEKMIFSKAMDDVKHGDSKLLNKLAEIGAKERQKTELSISKREMNDDMPEEMQKEMLEVVTNKTLEELLGPHKKHTKAKDIDEKKAEAKVDKDIQEKIIETVEKEEEERDKNDAPADNDSEVDAKDDNDDDDDDKDDSDSENDLITKLEDHSREEGESKVVMAPMKNDDEKDDDNENDDDDDKDDTGDDQDPMSVSKRGIVTFDTHGHCDAAKPLPAKHSMIYGLLVSTLMSQNGATPVSKLFSGMMMLPSISAMSILVPASAIQGKPPCCPLGSIPPYLGMKPTPPCCGLTPAPPCCPMGMPPTNYPMSSCLPTNPLDPLYQCYYMLPMIKALRNLASSNNNKDNLTKGGNQGNCGCGCNPLFPFAGCSGGCNGCPCCQGCGCNSLFPFGIPQGDPLAGLAVGLAHTCGCNGGCGGCGCGCGCGNNDGGCNGGGNRRGNVQNQSGRSRDSNYDDAQSDYRGAPEDRE